MSLEIKWTVPGCSKNCGVKRSNRAQRCLELASICARDFDSSFAMHDADRECALPQFHPDELVLSKEPTRMAGFQTEYILREAKAEGNDVDKDKTRAAAKRRFASRSDDGYYSVKFLQEGIVELDHAHNATTEMILEVKILMSLSQHPHISKIHGITSAGMTSLLTSGRMGYFYITDRVAETLVERMDKWRENIAYLHGAAPDVTQRLEVALDIASALVFLHDRKLVFYIRPDKVGFDARQGSVKLFNFGQARQHGMESHPRSVTQSDSMSTLAYTAPEVFCTSASHPGTDVFGFGVMLWEMVSLQRPFQELDRSTHFEHVVRRNRRPLPVDENWDKDVTKMLRSCWHPYKRPTMKGVHSTLENRLLFQESHNEIQDTARILKRRNSEGIVQKLLKEIHQVSPRTLKRHHSCDRVLALYATKKGLEITEVDKPDSEQTGTRRISENSGKDSFRKVGNKRSSGKGKKESDLHSSAASLQLGDMSENMSRSESSLQCSEDLEKVLREVSTALSDPQTNVSNKSRGSKYVERKGSREQRHSSKKQVQRKSRGAAADSSFKSNGSNSDNLYVMGRDDCSEDLIASIIDQDDLNISPSTVNATYNSSQNPRNVNVSENTVQADSPQRVRRGRKTSTLMSAIGAIAATPSPSVMMQRLRARSRSRSRSKDPPEKSKSSSSSELNAFLTTKEPRTPLSLPSKESTGSKANAQTVVSQILARGPKGKSTVAATLRRPSVTGAALPEKSHVLLNEIRNVYDEKKRARRASVAEVKGTFDFYPDPQQKVASTKVLKQLEEVIKKSSPILKTQDYPSSPTKAIVMASKRMLGGIRRLGASQGYNSHALSPEHPETSSKPSLRRGSIVLDIVGQQLVDQQNRLFRDSEQKVTDIRSDIVGKLVVKENL